MSALKFRLKVSTYSTFPFNFTEAASRRKLTDVAWQGKCAHTTIIFVFLFSTLKTKKKSCFSWVKYRVYWTHPWRHLIFVDHKKKKCWIFRFDFALKESSIENLKTSNQHETNFSRFNFEHYNVASHTCTSTEVLNKFSSNLLDTIRISLINLENN